MKNKRIIALLCLLSSAVFLRTAQALTYNCINKDSATLRIDIDYGKVGSGLQLNNIKPTLNANALKDRLTEMERMERDLFIYVYYKKTGASYTIGRLLGTTHIGPESPDNWQFYFKNGALRTARLELVESEYALDFTCDISGDYQTLTEAELDSIKTKSKNTKYTIFVN
jgi:hypothetical protein